MNGEELANELMRRSDADQAARSAVRRGDRDALARVMQIDDDNASWLENIVETVGWPGRSQVGDAGSHAAWLLAQHADRRPALQRRCLTLLDEAVASGDASPVDLAHLTDRVLLSSGEEQIYGTQLTARDGRFAAIRLRDPETVDNRRKSVGLEKLETHLRRALELFGPPAPAPMLCPMCGGEIEVWLPEPGGKTSVTCPACRSVTTIRPDIQAAKST